MALFKKLEDLEKKNRGRVRIYTTKCGSVSRSGQSSVLGWVLCIRHVLHGILRVHGRHAATETASSLLLPSEAAPEPATWAGLLLRSLRRLGVEPLQLLQRGGRRAPAGHCFLGRRGFAHDPHECALLCASWWASREPWDRCGWSFRC